MTERPIRTLSADAAGSMARLRAALGRLGRSRSVAHLVERVPREVCRGCGVERAVLFSVHEAKVVVESAHFEGDSKWAAEFLQFARSTPQQSKLGSLETKIVRRRTPVLVADTQKDPRRSNPLTAALRMKSYAAAPIMPEGRVIGILLADCYFSGRELNPLDLDTLCAFAERFGYAVERVALLERLRSQQDRVQALLSTTLEALSGTGKSNVDLGSSRRQVAAGSDLTLGLSSPADGLEDLLTPRELEVLALLASGSTNVDVASRLVISESTVKSHVKHILRKLEAGNRAEAVSRYMLASLQARSTPQLSTGGSAALDSPSGASSNTTPH